MPRSMRWFGSNLRKAGGLRLSRECALYFWLGWLAWVLAVVGASFGEYILRVPDPPGMYIFEAGAAMLSLLAAIYAAVWLAIAVYRKTYLQLHNLLLGPLILDQQVTERIQRELRGNLLLRWFGPPKHNSIRAQLLIAPLWWPVLCAPEGSPHWQCYGEWTIDVLLGYIPVAVAAALAIYCESWRALGLMALVGAIGMATLGHSSIRLAARRQAILDFFNTWLDQKLEA